MHADRDASLTWLGCVENVAPFARWGSSRAVGSGSGLTKRTPKSTFVSLIIAISAVFFCSLAIAQESVVKISHVRTIPVQYSASGIAWSQDATRLAAISNFGRTMSIWDAAGDLLRTIQRDDTLGPYNGPIAFLPNGHMLLAPAPTKIPGRQENAFALWNVDTGEIERVISGPAPRGDAQANRVERFVLSPDGSLVAMWPNMKNAISVYSTRDWHILAQQKIVRSDLLLDYHNDKTPPTTVQLLSSFTWSVQSILAIGLDRGVVLMEPLSSSPIAGFIPSVDTFNSGRAVPARAFNPNGQLLALGISLSTADFARKRAEESGRETVQEKSDLAYLKIWDVVAKQFIACDPALETPVVDVEWNSDGRLLLALTVDGYLRVYEPLTRGGAPSVNFRLAARPIIASFSPATGDLAILLNSSDKSSIEIFRLTMS